MRIPDEILDSFARSTDGIQAQATVRAMSDLRGAPGETYCLSDGTNAFLYARSLSGEPERFTVPLQLLQNMQISVDRPFAYVTIAAGDEKFELKFAAAELPELYSLAKRSASQSSATTQAATPEASEIGECPAFTPAIGLCAMLFAMAHVDRTKSAVELKAIEILLRDQKLLADGRRYWKSHGSEQLIEDACTALTDPQKCCIMANLLEIAMVDGSLEESEKKFLEQVRTRFGVDVAEFNKMFDVLILKNNLTIL